jgi:hypothetical protein
MNKAVLIFVVLISTVFLLTSALAIFSLFADQFKSQPADFLGFFLVGSLCAVVLWEALSSLLRQHSSRSVLLQIALLACSLVYAIQGIIAALMVGLSSAESAMWISGIWLTTTFMVWKWVPPIVVRKPIQ